VKFSYDGQAFDVAPTAGNLTTKSVFDDLDDKWITISSTYDVYGNVLTATDGRGKVTQYFYDDTTHALPNRVVVDPQNGTGAQTTTTVYDYATGLVTSVTDPNSATSTISYMNQLLNAVDPFGRPGVTTGPLVNVGGTNQHHRVTTTYEDHSLRVIVASDLNSEDDKLLKTRTTTDMLGRTVLVEQTEDGTNYTLYSQQAYAQAGRITLSSSVMRSGSSSSTDSWTRVTNDVLGRVSEVITFGGATQPPSTGTTAAATGTVATAYNANFTTVTDQAGKVRRSVVDAIGRLIRVDEPDASNNLGTTTAPVQPTSYAYDVFGNLTTVTQGAQTRTFTYDSLSRLRTAVNPESGSIAYQYDDNGNLLVKTDARGVSAHFEYDSLNRIKRRWYNGSNLISGTTHNIPALPAGVGATDEVKFYYDSQVLPTGAPSYTRGATVGRLVAQTYGTSIDGDYYAYDALGRATLKYQQTGSIAYPISASYNLSGALTTLTYPSGHSVTNSYDQAGRLSAFSGNLGDNITRTYATGILYSPTGGLVKEQFGTAPAIYTKRLYNSRGQLFDTRVSSVNDTWDWNRGRLILYYSSNHIWGQSGTDNNGNVRSAEVWIPPQNATLDQADTLIEDSYTYDALNRLTSVSEQRTSVAGGWGNWQQQFRQQYTYDRYGNRTIDAAQTWGTGINNKQFTVNTATNRLAVPAGQSGVMSYDAAGNLTNDTYTGAGNRTYDAENKITSAWGGNNQAQLYGYDASGQRIKRTVDGVTTWQVYGFGGELLAEYAANGTTGSPQNEYGYRNGQLLITASPANSGSGSGGCNSLAVNGSTAYVEVPNSSNLNIAGALTMEAWIKLPAVSTTYQPIIDKSPSVGNEGGYDLFVTDTGKARMDIFYSPSYQWLIGNTTLTAGVWHHLAGVYDGSQLRLYVDGQLDGSVNLSSPMTGSTVQLRIGKNNYLYGPLYFNGLIDEVRISTGALYSSNFTPAGTLTASSSTKGLWKFDGQTTNDSSANGNNGSLNGGATYSNDVPAAGGGGSAENVSWTNAMGVSSNGNSLTATANGWTAGASSTRAIMSGEGYVQFTASETSSYRMMALSHGDANQSYEELDFAFYLGQNGYLYIYENNVAVYFAGFYAIYSEMRGEEVRVMSRGGGWDVRIKNASGNYLDEFGNVGLPASTHGINVTSR
jgi:YD repeat-containing protein